MRIWFYEWIGSDISIQGIIKYLLTSDWKSWRSYAVEKLGSLFQISAVLEKKCRISFVNESYQ